MNPNRLVSVADEVNKMQIHMENEGEEICKCPVFHFGMTGRCRKFHFLTALAVNSAFTLCSISCWSFLHRQTVCHPEPGLTVRNIEYSAQAKEPICSVDAIISNETFCKMPYKRRTVNLVADAITSDCELRVYVYVCCAPSVKCENLSLL